MPVSIQELKRRKQVVCDAMEEGGVDVVVIGGSEKWEQRGKESGKIDNRKPHESWTGP